MLDRQGIVMNQKKLRRLQQVRFEARDKLRRLLDLVESSDVVDDDIKECIALRRGDAVKIDAELQRLEAPANATNEFSHDVLAQFGQLVAENIENGPIPFRKGYLRAVLDRVEVDDGVIRLFGNTHILAQAIKNGLRQDVQGVLRSVPKWRARHDSNV